MRDFIKLTSVGGYAIYVNSAMVLTVEFGHSNGSDIKMLMSDKPIHVKESPDEVVKLLNNNIKRFTNYDS